MKSVFQFHTSFWLPIKNFQSRKLLIYCKVASSRQSRLVANLRIFRLLMKGKFDAYVLWPLTKRVQNWILDQSTARDFTVVEIFLEKNSFCFFTGHFLGSEFLNPKSGGLQFFHYLQISTVKKKKYHEVLSLDIYFQICNLGKNRPSTSMSHD